MTDTNDLPFPEQGLVLTHFLTVRDVARSRDFYADIFGGRVVLEENPAIVKGLFVNEGAALVGGIPVLGSCRFGEVEPRW